MKGVLFIFVLVGFVANMALGQYKDTTHTELRLLSLKNTDILKKLNVIPDSVQTRTTAKSIMLSSPSMMPTAFFCKFEHRLDKSSKMPLRMRLGDVQYVDRIEGKSYQIK